MKIVSDPNWTPNWTSTHAARLADIALSNVAREYPHKLDHVMASDDDVLQPRVLHPAFHGSYDWHSCVHMHWLLVHLRRAFPGLPQRGAIDAVGERHFAPEAIAAECAYLDGPHTQSFERTYGWAWLLKLVDELHRGEDAMAARWRDHLAPLAAVVVARYLAYLPRADYPIRHGTHANSAFGLIWALDFARTTGAADLEALCVAKAQAWYGPDRNAPAAWEFSGADFLSPSLVEAELMRRVLRLPEFASWLGAFLPDLGASGSASLLAPVRVADRSDPQIVHLDGLNLTRAWCWRGIAASLPAGDQRIAIAHEAAQRHIEAGLAGIASDDYVGSHWLATFAALALAEPQPTA